MFHSNTMRCWRSASEVDRCIKMPIQECNIKKKREESENPHSSAAVQRFLIPNWVPCKENVVYNPATSERYNERQNNGKRTKKKLN
jgi:hypothetical protein